MSTATDTVSIALPKFLVTTVEPKSNADGKFVFNSKSKESSKVPVFLKDVKYGDKASVAGKWVEPSDEGRGKEWAEDTLAEGDFSGRVVTQAEFTEALAKEGKEVVFFIHGMSQQTREMAVSTEAMQTNFDSKEPEGVLVVPIDWACADPGLLGNLDKLGLIEYHKDKETNSKLAGSALWKLFSGLKKEGSEHTLSLNVIAHSMGNRVLRYVGKEAAEDSSFYTDALKDGTTLLQAAPEDLKRNKNLFDNIFFVSADIPESVFDEPDVAVSEQAEHGLQSGLAALAVMTKRMHVLHANGHDADLNASFLLNLGHARLGSRGPWSGGEPALGGKSTKVWEKIGDALEKYEGVEEDGNTNNGNVYVQDCSGWNRKADPEKLSPEWWPKGHSYQFYPQSVAYYLKHMTKGV